ncbi:MAG: hypothetical protein H6658_02235 [Ardenticatenaceae bacterium]|nr:hypothetical protein [Ardenticatenaceae bacterium]
MITITITRSGFHYTQAIIREDGKRTFPTTRNHAMEVVEENPEGHFDGSGEFDTRQPHDWKWQAEVVLEAV